MYNFLAISLMVLCAICARIFASNVLSVAPLPSVEYNSLHDLYNATNGAEWRWFKHTTRGVPWNFSVLNANPCTDNWEGVNCSIVADQYHISKLKLSLHNLSGQMPESLGNLEMLKVLDLSFNRHLNGTVPVTLSALTLLGRLDLSQCSLSGPVLNLLPTMKQLEYVDLHLNSFTGTIPRFIGNLTKLTVFYFHENAVSGTIPESIGRMTNLFWVNMKKNKLNGTIPEAVWALPRLGSLYLDVNELVGTVPSSILLAASMRYLNLSSNLLTGTLPNTLGQMSRMLQLAMNDNMLHGTLPSSIGNMRRLRTLDFSENRITGTIPPALSQLTYLKVLEFQDNLMTGPLVDCFSSLQTNITTIRLDGNQFTGELPAVLFKLPSLISLSIVSSCLHGTLPDNICEATNLSTLILYGLTIGDSCRGSGVEAFSRRHQAFGGPFPSCLLSMPNLQTLLLSSSGLTGSINGEVTLGPLMRELDLSHNRLTGSIPDTIQNHSWSLLDLSHNKLNGALHNFPLPSIPFLIMSDVLSSDRSLNFTTNSLSLTTNRLSGATPASVLAVHNVSVLAGNLFACKYDRSDLPRDDGSTETYACGSNSFNVAIYIWLGVITLLIFTSQSWMMTSHKLWAHLLVVSSLEVSIEMIHLQALFNKFGTVLRASWYCTAYCVTVLLPCYSLLSEFYGTHMHQYAYVVSAIYNTGEVPFAVDVLCLASIVVIFYYVLCIREVEGSSVTSAAGRSTSLQRVYVWLIFAIFNVTVVLGVNIAFVYAVLYKGSHVATVAQIALSIFKLVWGVAVSPYMIRHLDGYFIKRDENNHAEPFFGLQLLVALFNNIATPCLVVMAIDPNCFSEILLPPNVQTVNYVLPMCLLSDNGWPCQRISYHLAALQFTPPFTYSYQCSASFITSYAPTFVYMSISTVLLTPLLQYTLMHVYPRLANGSTIQYLVHNLMPVMMRPLAADTAASSPSCIGAVSVLVNLLTQLGILLTFGAIFPPVALAMAVSIASMVYMMRVKVQRFVQAAVDAQLLGYLDVINAECAGVGTVKQMLFAGRVLLIYSCAFYTPFLFDTLGDKTGFYAAAWVLFVVPAVPVVGYVSSMFYNRNTGFFGHPSHLQEGLELQYLSNLEKAGATTVVTINIFHDTGNS